MDSIRAAAPGPGRGLRPPRSGPAGLRACRGRPSGRPEEAPDRVEADLQVGLREGPDRVEADLQVGLTKPEARSAESGARLESRRQVELPVPPALRTIERPHVIDLEYRVTERIHARRCADAADPV